MPRILAYTGLHPGHLFPTVAAVLELRKRGHDVVIGAESFGLGAADVDGIPIIQRRAAASLSAEELADGRVTRLPVSSREIWDFALLGEPSAVNLEACVTEVDPDLLLIDASYWGAVVGAEASALPWAAISNNPLSFRATGADLRGPGRRPPRTWIGSLWYRVLCTSMRTLDDRRLPFINEVREKRGLSPLRHTHDMAFLPSLLFANTAQPFEYPRSDWPKAVRFVGPLVWDPPTPTPQWIEALDDRPLVLVVGSTLVQSGRNESSEWADIVLEALASEDVQVVATLPADKTARPVPSNARIESFVPHAPLIARAHCVICHGGWGVTQRALSAGVPVIAIPTGYDRFEIGRRLEVSRAGCMLSVGRLSADSIRAALRAMTDCRAGARRIAATFADTRGALAVADALEEVLRDTRSHWRSFS
jgi:UDP:flavonoid glycosyltransferase YjiC (YdhE family)